MRTFAVIALACVVFLSGCAGLGVNRFPGFIYADYHYPAFATGGPGSKTGTSKAISYLGWVSQGDASIKAAAEAGGITDVKTVDHHLKNIVGIYAEWTTIVTGD